MLVGLYSPILQKYLTISIKLQIEGMADTAVSPVSAWKGGI
jgi:hypothetical protein